MLQAFIIIFIVIFDQVSKNFAVHNLKSGGEVPFIPGILSFQYHENKGAAWGMLAEHRWVFMTLSTVAIILIIAFLFYTRKEKNNYLFKFSLCFFAGGGIGNMIDRIFQGYVVDFLNFEFIEFPIFNVADSFISIGAVMLVIYLVFDIISDFRRKKDA